MTLMRDWEMKLCNKRSVSKIRQMLGPFQNPIADGLGHLVRNRSQEKCLCQQQQSIGLLHQGHLLAKRCSRSQRCVKPGLRISVMQGLRRQEIGTSFSWIQLFVKKLQSFDMNLSINLTKLNKLNHTNYFSSKLMCFSTLASPA